MHAHDGAADKNTDGDIVAARDRGDTPARCHYYGDRHDDGAANAHGRRLGRRGPCRRVRWNFGRVMLSTHAYAITNTNTARMANHVSISRGVTTAPQCEHGRPNPTRPARSHV